MSDWVTLRDALRLTLRPIDVWPGKLRSDYQREKSPYSAPLKDTLATLKRELSALRAGNIVRFHPDNGGDVEKFLKIQAAAEVLKARHGIA